VTVVRQATNEDLDEWLEIVREVEPLFGPMPDFAAHGQRAIERGTALVVNDRHNVVGACLLSPEDKPHEIRWLAVREASRRQGLGSLLMDAIEQRWTAGDISVVTFADSVQEGEAARAFYEKRGFEFAGEAPDAPDGGRRVRYVLPAAARLKR
jgi:ribosomal protein S18 acetylase RimI-like enzyme